VKLTQALRLFRDAVDPDEAITKRQLDGIMTVSGPEIAVSGAVVLGSGAFGKMHALSGTTNYAVTLPAAAGNAGRVIGFRVTASATALITLDGNAAETIDGQEARILWAQESAVLLCDGAGWTKIGGRSRPMICRMRIQNSADVFRAQQIANNAMTAVVLNQIDQDQGGMADLVNNRINIRRSSRYWLGYVVYYSTADATLAMPRALGNVQITASPDAARVGVRPTQSEGNAYSAVNFAGTTAGLPSDLLAGEALVFQTFQTSGEARWLFGHPTGAATLVYALEAPTW
jgi:hypothetical protein